MRTKIELAEKALKELNETTKWDFLNAIGYKDDWEFLEKYMDYYTGDDRITWIDIADKYFDGDLAVDGEPYKWITAYGTDDDIYRQREIWEYECMIEAIENWLAEEGYIPVDNCCLKCGTALVKKNYESTDESEMMYLCTNCGELWNKSEINN